MTTTTTTKTASVKQKCFNIVRVHPDRCILYVYGKKVELFTEDDEILSCLRNARFGSNLCLVYCDALICRHYIYVLVDECQWIEISDCMSALIYSYTRNSVRS